MLCYVKLKCSVVMTFSFLSNQLNATSMRKPTVINIYKNKSVHTHDGYDIQARRNTLKIRLCV